MVHSPEVISLKSVGLVREVMGGVKGSTPTTDRKALSPSPSVLLQTYERRPKEWETFGGSVGSIVKHFEGLNDDLRNDAKVWVGHKRVKKHSEDSRNESRSSGIVSDMDEDSHPDTPTQLDISRNSVYETTPPIPTPRFSVSSIKEPQEREILGEWGHSSKSGGGRGISAYPSKLLTLSFLLFLCLLTSGCYGAYLFLQHSGGGEDYQWTFYCLVGVVVYQLVLYWKLDLVGVYFPGFFTNIFLVLFQPCIYLLSSSTPATVTPTSITIPSEEETPPLSVDLDDSGYMEEEEEQLHPQVQPLSNPNNEKNNNDIGDNYDYECFFSADPNYVEGEEETDGGGIAQSGTENPKNFLFISFLLGIMQLFLVVLLAPFQSPETPHPLLFSFLFYGQLSQLVVLLILGTLTPALRFLLWSRGQEKEE